MGNPIYPLFSFQKLPGVPVILITPPPIWEEKLQYFNKEKGKTMLIDRTNERLALDHFFFDNAEQIDRTEH